MRLVANHTILPRLRMQLFEWSGIAIGKNVFINMDFLVIDDYKGGMVAIEDEVAIAPRVTLVPVSYPNQSFINQGNLFYKEGIIYIRNGAWIGTGVVILPGITIGVGAIVGAQSLVTRDVPDYCIVGGVPAKIIGDVRNPKSIKMNNG